MLIIFMTICLLVLHGKSGRMQLKESVNLAKSVTMANASVAVVRHVVQDSPVMALTASVEREAVLQHVVQASPVMALTAFAEREAALQHVGRENTASMGPVAVGRAMCHVDLMKDA